MLTKQQKKIDRMAKNYAAGMRRIVCPENHHLIKAWAMRYKVGLTQALQRQGKR
ncbi:unnamed protein product [marine sediment metagenome]|uniref:Uncharacterized protein n=1 Tax=marine sediment metagenome TaxID=412755 RepID=X1QGL8_9ZZZZ